LTVWLATVASHTVNGVAALHSRLLTETVLKDFAQVSPKKFTNVTNGVTPRRFLALANPGLTRLITEAIGDAFLKDHERLKDLKPFADDPEFRARFRKVKRMNKDTLANYLAHEHHIGIDPSAMLDAQCKRIHEYKRQHLAALHMVSLYDRIRNGDIDDIAPRTFLFAGKAAPAYRMAKLIVRLIHGIADVVRQDPHVKKWMSVVFFPDFNVKNAQRIYPAADLSEQISTAGLEASGTGNMKFAMNGALTIGTLDGANVEIREHVGADNFFLFGMTTEEVVSLQQRGYRPSEWIGGDPELARVIDLVASGHFSNGEPGVFDPLVANLRDHDPFCVLADFRQYVYSQRGVSRAWGEQDTWTKKAILNVASMGHFSSDRSINEYAKNVWRVPSVKVK
jgi:starch phosphorylase